MNSSAPAPLIWLLAGEASGDVLGARLIDSLRARRPELRFAGVGGPRMAERGLHSLFEMRELSVMGLVEVLPRVRRLSRLMALAQADVVHRRPDLVITIDSPGFALRLLARLRGVTRVHYVAPQVWAWREHRVKHYPGRWERLLCLLPFEPEFFARHGIEARFVGHPVLQSGADRGDGARFRARHRIGADAPVLVLMPGSRRSEVPRLLPVFARTLGLLRQRFPDLVAVVPVAQAVAATVQHAARDWPVRAVIVTDLDDKHDAYAAAGAALTKSGTSTLELALAGVPMAVTYRVNPLTAMIARRLIRVPYVAMINLLAGRALVPELLQGDCRPDRLAEAVGTLLTDRRVAQTQRDGFRAAMAGLAPNGESPSDAAAREVIALLS